MSDKSPQSPLKKAIAFLKILILFFMLCVVVTLTYQADIYPYNIYLIGIECSVFCLVSLMLLRMNTYKPRVPYDGSNLATKNEQLHLLLTKISDDISYYEEGAS